MAELVSGFRILTMYPTVDSVTPDVFAITLVGLVPFLFNPNDDDLHLHRHLFGPYIESSTELLPNAG